LARNLECKLGSNVNISVIYFIADRRMYNSSYVIVLGACVHACVYALYFASSLG